MRDIAVRAGVHQTTVSMALRNHPQIPPATCQRIQALAQEMGYRPNPLISALMTQRRRRRPERISDVLAVLTGDPYLVQHSLWHKNSLSGIRERARVSGFGMDVFRSEELPADPRRLTQILRARGILGVIAFPPHPETTVPKLEWSRFAGVTVGFRPPGLSLHSAQAHHFQAMELALKQLVAAGARRIGLWETSICSGARNNPFHSALLSYQEAIPASRRIPPLNSRWIDRRAFPEVIQWFKRWKPDAWLTGGGVEWAALLAELGFVPPKDLLFALLDWNGEACAGINQFPELHGACAVDVVVEQLRHNERGIPPHPKHIFIETDWVPGVTVPG